MTPTTILSIVFLICLGVWAYQDRKEHRVTAYKVLGLGILYLVVYLWAFISNPYAFIAFAGIGFIITLGIVIALRKQLAPLDHCIILIGNVTLPYLSVPAFVLSMVLLHIYRRQRGDAFIFFYFVAFLVVISLEAIL